MNRNEHLRLIESLIDRKLYEEVVTVASSGINQFTDNGVFYAYRGLVNDILKNYEDALPDLDEAIKLDIDNADLYHARANSNYELNHYKDAVADYDSLVENGWELAAYEYSHAGYAKMQLNLYKQAIPYLKQAIKLEPDEVFYQFLIGCSYYEIKDYKNAEKHFAKIVKAEPDNGLFQFDYGDSLYHLEKYEDAIVHFNRAIMITPDDSVCYRGLIDCYTKLNDYKNIVKYGKKAVGLKEEDDYYFYYSIGRASYYLEKYDEALEYAKKLIETDSDYPGGYAIISCIYDKKGDYEKALEYNEEALSISPESDMEMLYNNKIEFLTKLNRLDEIKKVKTEIKNLKKRAGKIIRPYFGNNNTNPAHKANDENVVLFGKKSS